MSTVQEAQEVRHYLSERYQEMVDFLKRLTMAESPTTEPESQAMVQTILWEAFTDLEYEVEHVAGRKTGGHLYAKSHNHEQNGRRQLLLGHTDTVWPVGTLREMPLEIDGRVMKGPGVYDMKSGLTQIVYALKALRDLKLEPAVAPVVFINSDEEIGSPESRTHIAQLARQAERALVLEPAIGLAGKLKTGRKGVGRFNIVVKGKAAHAGMEPEKGVSAILELSYLIQKLFALNEPQRGVTVNVGVIEGGMEANVIAPQSRALVDVRVPTTADAQRLESAILNLKPSRADITLEIEGEFNRPPMERTPQNQALWQTAKEVGRQLGLELEEGVVGGGSDGNLTSPFTATLDGLGAIGGGAHAPHEFVHLDKMVERCALLALLLLAG